MRLLEISIQNFLSFGNAQTLNMSKRGLVAVFGSNKDSKGSNSNGAGKSSVGEAVVWCLFGKTMRGYKGDEVVNRSTQKNCKVILRLENAGVTYKVVRTRKAAGKKPNDLRLFADGKETTLGINCDTQQSVDTLVGMDYATFTQSVFLSQDVVSFSNLNDASQKAVLENILGLRTIARAKEVVKNRSVEKQRQHAKACGKLEIVKAQHADLTTSLHNLQQRSKQHAAIVEQQRKALVDRKASVEDRIKELRSEQNKAKLQKAFDKLVTKSIDIQNQKKIHAKDRFAVAEFIYAKKEQVARQEGAINHRIEQLHQDIKTLDDIVGKPCPTCKQTLHPDAAEHCMIEWGNSADILSTFETVKLAKLRAGIEKLEKKKLAEIQSKESTLDDKWAITQAQIETTKETLNKSEEAFHLARELEQQASSIQKEIDSLSTDATFYDPLIQEAQENIKNCQAEKEKIEAEICNVEKAHALLAYWDHGFSNAGLKSYIFDCVLPFLNERVMYYANILSGGDLEISFSTQTRLKNGSWKEKFQILATNRQGANIYKGNSAGEKRRIDVAVGWALADLAASRSSSAIRLRVLDEPFESIDEVGEDAIIKLLYTVLPKYETILCITHSDHLRNQFPHDIIVEKKRGVSTILESTR